MLALVQIGRTGKTYGNKGYLRLYTDIDIEKQIAEGELRFLFLEMVGSRVPYAVEYIESLGDLGYKVKFKQIDSPEQASEFANSPVFIEQERIAQLVEEHPLKALDDYRIFNSEEIHIATIREIMEYPQQLMARVVDPEDRERLIPLVEEWIQEIDHEEQKLIMDLPEGLI